MRILVVEDEKKVLSFIKRGLEEEKYMVDTAMDGEEGLKMALDKVYDLIVLDWMLPKKDGLAMVKELRAKKTMTPVLMLTAKDSVEDQAAFAFQFLQRLESGTIVDQNRSESTGDCRPYRLQAFKCVVLAVPIQDNDRNHVGRDLGLLESHLLIIAVSITQQLRIKWHWPRQCVHSTCGCEELRN